MVSSGPHRFVTQFHEGKSILRAQICISAIFRPRHKGLVTAAGQDQDF